MSSSDNTTVTASEEALLQYVGRYELTNFGSLIVVTLFYGIFITLFSMSIYITIRRGIRTFATWAVLIGTSISFAQQTVQWIMTLTWVIFYLQIFLVHNGQLSLEDRLALELKFGTHFLVPINELQPVPLLISDAFVIWRASVLFTRRNRHSRAIAIPVICLVGTLGAFIASAVIPSDNSAAIFAASWALLALSITTNFLSTGMIGYRLWIYRKDVLPNLDGRKSPAHQIIITLVESGAAFCILQVAFLIIQLATASDTTNGPIMDSGIVIQQTLLSLAAIYPTFIILICRNHSSRIDEVASISMNTGNDLRFAAVQESQSQSIPGSRSSTVNFATQSRHSSLREAEANTSDIEKNL